MVALVATLAGCVTPDDNPYPSPEQITIRQVEVPGYGLCTFAGVNRDWSDSMVLVGCTSEPEGGDE